MRLSPQIRPATRRFGRWNGTTRDPRELIRAFGFRGSYSGRMKRSRVPFVTAVYEERVTWEPSAKVAGTAASDGASKHFECDLCGTDCEGSPFSSGLLVWFRGDEMRVDEPPLCEECASRITIGAAVKWAIEGEEEG
jgi:hypothetical protein